MRTMYLDVTKKVGDASAIKTAEQIIKELEEKLAEAQKSLVDYETDWVKMRKYYDVAKEKMKMLDEAIEVIGFYADTDNWLEEKDRNNLYTIIMNDASDDFDDLLRFGGKRAREFLVKIKDPRSVQEKFNDIANGRD